MSTDKITSEDVVAIATQVATKWRRKVFGQIASADNTDFSTQLDDLRHEAVIAILEATRYFDPSRGVPFYAYAEVAASRRLWRVVARAYSTISGSVTHAPARVAMQLARQTGEELDIAGPMSFDPAYNEWRASVRATLEAAVGDLGPADLILLVVGKESTPAAESARTGIPVKRIYRMARAAKERLAASQKLRALWAEVTCDV